MIQLFYKDENDVAEVLSKVKDLSLAIQHQMNSKNQIMLADGQHEVIGVQNILIYLNDLESELHIWRYCGC